MTSTLSFAPGAVIVAGGSGGIGAGICKRFAAAGMPVCFTYHSDESKALSLRAEIESSGGKCEYEKIDLAVPEQVEKLVAGVAERHGRISNVIYAAGPHFEFNFIGSIPDEDWHRVVNADINERVPVKDIMSAAPKAAIEMLIRGVAKESGRLGIRANCVGPGWILAGLGKKGIEEKLDEKQRQAILRQNIPLQRFGEADDIAQAALFLCSEQANYITGQSIAVDGGLQL